MTALEDRPRFYEGQYLGAADLTAVVDYTRVQRARALLGGHSWGISLGLDLVEVKGPNATLDVVVQPGYGWDGFGRPIVVSEPAKLPVTLFSSYDSLVTPGNPAPAPVLVKVWIRYDETLSRGTRPGFEQCDTGARHSRVTERYAFEVGPRNSLAAMRDPVEIAGRTVDASQALKAFDQNGPELFDGNVPHQMLPGEGDFALWLIPLGVVNYQPGIPGRFVKLDDKVKKDHTSIRRYTGVIAGSIEATGGVVRVHDRTKKYSNLSTDELLRVEGDIRSDGDIRLYGSKVEFVNAADNDTPVPFEVLRSDDPVSGTRALTMVIGDKGAGENRLVVASVDAQGARQPKLVVTDNGHVGIGTGDAAPTHPLQVQDTLGIRQCDMYLSGNIGWSSLTFNAHHDAANAAWVFPNPNVPAVTLEMHAAAGRPRFEVYSTIPGNNQSWASRMLIDGHSGNVGIGTQNPTARLEVDGDLRFAGLFGVGAASGVRVVWGAVAAAGSIQAGNGFAASHAGTGRYKLTFTPAFSGQPTLIVTRVHQLLTVDNGNSVTASETAVVDQVLSHRAVVATADTNGARADGGFTFVAIGPR